jgi:hypothetical protein
MDPERSILARSGAGRKTRWCMYAVAACAGLAVLLALFYGEEDWRGLHAWEQFQKQWQTKGERFDWASIIPPPVPDDQNFALTPIVFSSYAAYVDKTGSITHQLPNTNVIDRLRMSVYHGGNSWILNRDVLIYAGDWRIAKPTDLSIWQNYLRNFTIPAETNGRALQFRGGQGRGMGQIRKPSLPLRLPTNDFPIASQPQTPAADVLLALSKYDSALAELREASRLPRSRFPLDYEHPEEIMFAGAGNLERCALVLKLRSIAELSLNRTSEALDDIQLALRLAEFLRSEPFFNWQKDTIKIVGEVLQPIWEGLAAHRWSDGELDTIESELSKLDFFSDYATAVRGERAMASYEIDRLRVAHNATLESGQVEDWVEEVKVGLSFFIFTTCQVVGFTRMK